MITSPFLLLRIFQPHLLQKVMVLIAESLNLEPAVLQLSEILD